MDEYRPSRNAILAATEALNEDELAVFVAGQKPEFDR